MKYANISIVKGNVISHSQNKSAEQVVNIGDWAQLFAIDNIYREMGIREEEIVRIEYYDLFDYDGEELILPINFIYFNPFYGERPLIFSPKIIPVFLGIHCISAGFSKEEIQYLKKYQPIGCRDEYTLNTLKGLKIEAYLQGCISATLPQRKEKIELVDGGKVFFVDAPDSLKSFIPKELLEKSEFVTHQYYGNIYDTISNIKIRDFVRAQFDRYMNEAALIVTSRLHCASPCAAMGIPTIFAVDNYGSSYAWLERILRVYTHKNFADINWNPAVSEYEQAKKNIIELAKNKILDVVAKHKLIAEVQLFYINREKVEFEIGYLVYLKKHAEKYWDKNSNLKYALWGITQMADIVYDYLQSNFPNAQLVAIFDDYRTLTFKGIKSITTKELNRSFDDCCIIATGNSSCIAANELFTRQNRNPQYYCLWGSGKYSAF